LVAQRFRAAILVCFQNRLLSAEAMLLTPDRTPLLFRALEKNSLRSRYRKKRELRQ